VRAAIPVALELPCREATDVDVELVQSGVITIAGELNLELELIFRDGLTAHRAGRTNSRAAPIGSSAWQLSSADNFSGLLAEDAFVGHSGFPRSGGVVMPDARRPGRRFASPGEPDGRQRQGYSLCVARASNESTTTRRPPLVPGLRINRVLRAMLQTRRSAEAWPQVKAEF
jgi:hypothetical protein